MFYFYKVLKENEVTLDEKKLDLFIDGFGTVIICRLWK